MLKYFCDRKTKMRVCLGIVAISVELFFCPTYGICYIVMGARLPYFGVGSGGGVRDPAGDTETRTSGDDIGDPGLDGADDDVDVIISAGEAV